MLKLIGADIVIQSFFTKIMHEGQENAPVSVPQQWFQKLLGILKIWLLGEVFEPKLRMFSKNYFFLPQSTYFVIAPFVSISVLEFIETATLNTTSFSNFSWSGNYTILVCKLYMSSL